MQDEQANSNFRKEWTGKPRPAATNADGMSTTVGAAAAADILCQLKTDTQGLRRALAETKAQTAEVIAGQAMTNDLLREIRDLLRDRKEHELHLVEVANRNTDRICAKHSEPSK